MKRCSLPCLGAVEDMAGCVNVVWAPVPLYERDYGGG